MSAFEQKIEAPNKDFQYLLFACDPYDTIGFKIPNIEIDKLSGGSKLMWGSLRVRESFQEDPPPSSGGPLLTRVTRRGTEEYPKNKIAKKPFW